MRIFFAIQVEKDIVHLLANNRVIRQDIPSPPVSVVVVVRGNSFYFIEHTLPLLLGQQYDEFEVVLVDCSYDDEIGEILREKLLLCLDKEVPHGTAVELTKFSERDDEVIEADATIYCEKESHKGIIIGKKGAMLKKISTMAREDMEAFMGTKVFLQTWVKVKENWRDNLNLVHNFGYRDD